ncbi:MAG: LytS/YhcK type 5TM receptor domain-containing protein [Bacteroidales bacterium]
MVLGLIQNIATLLAFSLLYDLVWGRENRFNKILYKILLGIVIGGIGIILMMTPWVMTPGVVFDTRSILLVNTGLFFGPVPTLIAVLITALFRVYLGGPGVYMGVAVAISSGAVGYLWKRFNPDWRKGNYIIDLFKVGLLTHIIMLCWTILLPNELILLTLKKIIFPVLIIYPLGVIMLGRILIDRMSGWKMKNELKLTGKRYETFINANKDCMFVKDEQFRYIIANDKMCEFFNRSKEEIINKTDSELDSLNLIAPCPFSDKRALEEDKLFTVEEKLGESVYEITKFPVFLSKEKIGVGGIMRDITESKKKRELQQVLLDISRISIEDTDLRTFLGKIHSQMRRVIKSDNVYIALYHSDENKYSFPYYVDEYDKFESDEKISLENSLTDYIRVSGKGRLITVETEIEIEKEYHLEIFGEYSPVWMGAPLMNSSLKEVIGVVVVQDYKNANTYNQEDLLILEIVASNIGTFIERLTNLNNLKAAKKRAEESDRLKSAFLANISHEIRTPMNGIIGFTDVLMEEITDEKQKEYVSIINSSAYRLLNTVNDVIDVAKIEAGQVAAHNELFDVNDVLNEVYSFYNNIKLPFEFILSTPSKGKREIRTDKTKLLHIFSNLVSNAFKFTSDGAVEFGYEIDNNQMIFFVKDSGLGISKEDQDKIFNRFYQVGGGNQRIYEGTGLGLSIVKEYVNLLGGTIWVKSEPGTGTQFFFTICSEAEAD